MIAEIGACHALKNGRLRLMPIEGHKFMKVKQR
jgi:hypothetical protein